MIIQCPACATRYVVPDSAIGADGRTVRCAKCRHNWFQEGPELVGEPIAGQADPGVAPSPPPPAPTSAAAAPPPPPPAPVERAPDPDIPPAPPPVIDRVRPAEPRLPEHSPFDAGPPFRPRRNWLKVWTWAAGIFAVFAAAIIFAVSYWGLPDWVPVTRPDFAVGEPDLQLDFPVDQQEKREMPGGQEYFAVNGTITNIGSSARSVPAILVVLRDARERKVFELEIVPEKSTLAPGESVDITRAVLDVPRSARIAEIGWKAN
jgi:predicted Zn finger-like uncharacterized protein